MLDKHKHHHFLLFSNCIPVKGAVRSTICDLARGIYRFIPNSLYEIITDLNRPSLQEVIDNNEPEEEETIIEYFTFLIENEFGFFCSKQEIDLFPPIEKTFFEPATISNCIIDIDKDSELPFKKIFFQLSGLGCQHVQLRFFYPINTEKLGLILKYSLDLNFRSIEILKQFEYSDGAKLNDFFYQFPLTRINVFNVPDEYLVDLRENVDKEKAIYYFKQPLNSEKHCGVISPSLFTINLPTYLESLSQNSCLNRKIGIDKNGEIKNCPSMSKSFGNISETDLLDVAKNAEFSTVWKITKDQINICSACEFRYVCTDCRGYIEDPGILFSKPLKCGYDPYNCTWSDWETKSEKLFAIDFYKMSK